MTRKKKGSFKTVAPGQNVSDVRFLIHQPSSANLPPSYARPKKRLSHTSKAPLSAPIPGATQPIRARRFRRY